MNDFPFVASYIDIDSMDFGGGCANDPDPSAPFRMGHGPAGYRVVFGPGDVRRLCRACALAAGRAGAGFGPRTGLAHLNGGNA